MSAEAQTHYDLDRDDVKRLVKQALGVDPEIVDCPDACGHFFAVAHAAESIWIVDSVVPSPIGFFIERLTSADHAVAYLRDHLPDEAMDFAMKVAARMSALARRPVAQA